jgi:mono/diheme cytochrome c family protein
VTARKCIARIALALAALAPDEAPQSAVMSRGWEFGEQGGGALFSNVCAACHQPAAKGAVGAAAYPPLAADAKLASIDFLLSVLLQGLRGMPPVGRMMTDEPAISAADVSAARQQTKSDPPD